MITARRPIGRVLRACALGLVALAVCLVPAAAHAAPTAEPAAKASVPSASTSVGRARVAADVLMNSYDPDKAWFPSSWWNSAVALQTIGDYMQRTGDKRYLAQLDNTFVKDQGTFPAGQLSGDPLLGNFTSRAIDDSEWWGLTWVEAYDLTGQKKYLDMSIKIADYVYGYWDPSTCGGGVWWNAEKTYKNAVTNGLWIRLTAELHNRIHGDKLWLGRSTTAWNWYVNSGLINSDYLVNDGLNSDCTNNGQTVWSYNQGLAIGAGLEVYRETKNPQVLAEVRKLANAAMTSSSLTSNGILTESCDALDRTCDDNGKQFKGIFMRYWTDLVDTTHDPAYTAFLDTQANSIWNDDRDAANRLGTRWSGATSDDHPNVFDWRTQASALSALIGVIPVKTPQQSLAATMSPAQPVIMPSGTGSTQVTIDLGVSATGSEPIVADTVVNVPSGWGVAPATSSVRLNPHGTAKPVYGSTPLTITVPGTATDGDNEITATVSADGQTFTTQADVLVAHSIDFDTGTPAETPWLFDADGSQSNGVQSRFADGNSHFTYLFPFPADAATAQVTLTIENEYSVDVSSDNQNWTSVLKVDQPVTDSSNKAARTIDLTPYLGSGSGGDKPVYVRVSDAYSNDGWGGRVYHVTVTDTEQ